MKLPSKSKVGFFIKTQRVNPMEAICENGGLIPISKSEPIFVQPETSLNTNQGFYFLSNLDQNIAVIIQTVYCFKPDENKSSDNVGDVIKRALAKILVHFYPLTGNLRVSSDGKLIVECTNRGVPFVEAEADCNMDVLGDITVPDPGMLGKLVYTVPGAKHILEMPLLTAQVTRFKCGGFVLGMTINHCMTDGISAMEFVHSWAETARSKTLTLPPFLDRTILRSREPHSIKYPHKEFQEITDTSNMSTLYQEDQLVYNSFQFNQEKIARLKKTAMEDGIIKNCTTFTVLTALVWRARTKALKMKPNQQSKLLFAVDGRSKLNPPLPKGYFGNGIVLTCCICNASELIEKPLSFAVEHVQNAIKMVTEGFIRSAIDYFEVTRARPSLTATLLVTSWTRLDFDTTDFGWGEAVQSGCVNLPEKEVVLLLCNGRDTKITTLLLGLPITAMKTFQELMQV
ncbi:hypothetical protein CsSME_00018719 [Camellia sinensis var. sinensis]